MESGNLNQLGVDYKAFEAKSVADLYGELRDVQSVIFPGDVLNAASSESRYRQWIDYQLKPRLRKIGAEGELWWTALTKVDLAADPELLWRTAALITMWFFPDFHDYLRYTETLAFIALIRRLAYNEELGK